MNENINLIAMKNYRRKLKLVAYFLTYLLFMSFLGCKENVLTYNPFDKSDSELFARRF